MHVIPTSVWGSLAIGVSLVHESPEVVTLTIVGAAIAVQAGFAKKASA